MANIGPTGSTSMIPSGINIHLSNPRKPWQISKAAYERMPQGWGAGEMYKKWQLLPSDPECMFILKYFNHQKPSNYGIANIYFLHNPSHTQEFEGYLPKMDKRAETFKPEWDKEDFVDERRGMIRRWKEQVKEYYPIAIQRSDREDVYANARVVPLLHGTSGNNCGAIAATGFAAFGKHHFFDLDAKPGTFKNTDPGYFGSGMYFTNSAAYATLYCKGTPNSHLLVSWVLMLEPYPVINDVPHPDKGSDMKKFGTGRGGYQTYNAHYIPVAPTSNSTHCMEYFPCYKNQPPRCDEYVVFQEAQTLPRFWIELFLDFPKMLPANSPIPGSYVIDSTTLNATLLAGLSVAATCTSPACSKKDRAQWLHLGMGPFDLGEVCFNSSCTVCGTDFEFIHHFVIHSATYSLKGRDKQNVLTAISDKQMPPQEGIMVSHFPEWKYLKINLR